MQREAQRQSGREVGETERGEDYGVDADVHDTVHEGLLSNTRSEVCVELPVVDESGHVPEKATLLWSIPGAVESTTSGSGVAEAGDRAGGGRGYVASCPEIQVGMWELHFDPTTVPMLAARLLS